MNLLKIENLTKEYKTKVEDIKIFSNINLTIDKGDLISIQGKSGSGKTTLLNILGLLDTKYDGKVEFFNQSSYKSLEKLRAKNIGFVFQFHYLLPEFTALENVMLPALAMKESSKNEIRKRAIELLKLVDLEDRINFYPSELSGGQKQRVAIARALINNPSIVLADEPTGNLDEENSKKINDLFIKLNKENAQTIILVTHSQNLANIANKKYILKNRELVVVE
ncbi:ABC transporter ATP-binding protein [Sneathia vaginalis]|uniref:ABC transporter ATP-binding protein n=1 Tax=Sneathia vaginalis TaxID=187101 RepID=UPI00259A4270|nr:ABC transporter ATP-binding protein [uncultured Sneathia sp.]